MGLFWITGSPFQETTGRLKITSEIGPYGCISLEISLASSRASLGTKALEGTKQSWPMGLTIGARVSLACHWLGLGAQTLTSGEKKEHPFFRGLIWPRALGSQGGGAKKGGGSGTCYFHPPPRREKASTAVWHKMAPPGIVLFCVRRHQITCGTILCLSPTKN